ncbi:MAG: hypothetical protein H6867_03925 [Rhodospirillales bacterium]|nr:hypothetical protein [Rhodospirillales bacterium]MCB9996299.1 hypothetical protein [Rhodospirillales bacterium]
MRSVLLSLILCGFLISPVWAEEQAGKPDTEKQEKAELKKPENPHAAAVKEKARALAKAMSKEQAEQFSVIRENFGVLRSVRMTRKSVTNAVKECAAKNPDMKDAINSRYKSWDEGIHPVLEKQQKSMKASISSGLFNDPKQVEDYLDTVDDMAEYADNRMEKKVVTTPEACQSLIDSMDKSSEIILELIGEMNWPQKDAQGGDPKP